MNRYSWKSQLSQLSQLYHANFLYTPYLIFCINPEFCHSSFHRRAVAREMPCEAASATSVLDSNSSGNKLSNIFLRHLPCFTKFSKSFSCSIIHKVKLLSRVTLSNICYYFIISYKISHVKYFLLFF